MSSKKSTVSVAALAAAGALVAGGVAVANAATTTPTPTQSGAAGYSAPGYGQQDQQGGDGQQGRQGGQEGHRGHRAPGTAATAAQTAQVKAAVTAKDSTVTVEEVRVDQDGSFHARATKGGQPVHVRVSKDLKTVTVDTRGPGGHGEHGGPGGGRDTAATAAQTTQVKAAVSAKDSAITVTEVRVDPDGSYDALGTKAGQRVMVEVSKDLKTVEVRTGGPHGDGQQGQQGQQGGQQGQQGGAQTAPSGYSA